MKPKRLSILMGIFFIVAGVNHFVMPGAYLPLIPDYLPFPATINLLSGLLELIIAIGFFTTQYRRLSGWGMAILMVLFIPSHIHFIAIGSCVDDGLCVSEWVAWVRLIVIHPLLIYIGVWIARHQNTTVG
jgi:uncharacterized membrane protein